MSAPILLRVDGAVRNRLDLTFEDFQGFAEKDQVRDVSRFQPGKKGDGVALDALLDLAGPSEEANYLTLHAMRDDFHVSIPLHAVRREAVVLYKIGDEPLAIAQGGPIRFLIKDPAACHTNELDDCANVKYLDRIELTIRRGRDTRPADEAEHTALHARQES